MCSADAFNADDQWYDVVRRADKAVIYSFPAEGRYLVYRVNGIVSLRPLLEEEEIFTLNGFMQFAKRLGFWHLTGFVSLKSAYICAIIEKFTKEIIRNER
ncbi:MULTISPECIES: hypothetical protein [Enterobacter]|uniref:hypothetical protein n=2 Tax=Enterobacteriaceae TaxID=543 RepID=UPI002075F61A|nr:MULTISPECIES: hypothetical protein [Enterobacter]MCM7766337.1 hypothetical protein [Enterobacter bugandensis]